MNQNSDILVKNIHIEGMSDDIFEGFDQGFICSGTVANSKEAIMKFMNEHPDYKEVVFIPCKLDLDLGKWSTSITRKLDISRGID